MDEKINKVTNDEKNERFFINPQEFNMISQTKQILINKLELSKAINVNAQSGEAGYSLVPRSHDKKNLEFENKVVSDLDNWIRDREQNLKGELKRFYEDLDY